MKARKIFFQLALLILISLSISNIANAQAVSTSKLLWDETAPDLATAQAYTYKYYPDGAATGIVLTSVTCIVSTTSTTLFTCSVAFPAFTPGSHTLTLSAGDIAGDSAQSPAFSFTFVVVPGIPGNIRIGH